jgi:hypothetical protein
MMPYRFFLPAPIACKAKNKVRRAQNPKPKTQDPSLN